MNKEAFLFGYGNKAKTIAHGLRQEAFRFHIIVADEKKYIAAKDDGYHDVTLLDVTKDEDLAGLKPGEDDYLICVMEDEHLNVFLTLSLHALFPQTQIVAISDSVHTTQKLKMAGASKVIDLYQMSANRIHNILKKPVATKLLDDFITKGDGISFKEMTIPEGSYLHGKMFDDVNFQEFGVLLIGLIDKELSNKFTFITSGIDHKLDSGDVLVCIGDKNDLEKFEAHIQECCHEYTEVRE